MNKRQGAGGREQGARGKEFLLPLASSVRRGPKQKRVLICTFAALVSGVFSAYVGGQVSLQSHSHKCQTQPWGLKEVCKTWVAPGAIWQGSTTGLWMGWVLGAFVSGLATHKSCKENE